MRPAALRGSNPHARSLQYRDLAEAFRYPQDGSSQTSALDLADGSDPPGPAWLAAFDTAVSRSACSLHEAAYAGGERSALLEELVRFYAHFGLVREECAELPDHLAVELEFMVFLNRLEERCAQRQEDVAGVRRAQRDFLSRHLARLARGIAAACRSDDPSCASLVQRLREHVEADLARLGSALAG